MAIYSFPVNFLDFVREEFGDILIGRPVDRYTQLIAVDFFKLCFQFWAFEPVIAEPVEIGELLVGIW